MAWVRFKKLSAFPEGIHRIGRSKQEIVFNVAVEGGLVDVRHRDDLQLLLRLPDYELAVERYGVSYDAQGWEPAPSAPGAVSKSSRTDAGAPPASRPPSKPPRR